MTRLPLAQLPNLGPRSAAWLADIGIRDLATLQRIGVAESLRRLLAADLAAGSHAVVWRGRDDAGRDVASGTYFVRLRQGEATDVRALTLVR